jgi:hypothetical protein
MSEINILIAKMIIEKGRKAIINETTKIIEEKFQRRIRDMELYARIFYASILSSYTRASTLSNNVGIILPELETITKALYAMSRTKKNKQGSFEASKAFEIANTLSLSYKIPMVAKNNVLTYKLTFTINHPILVALEEGNVSWEGMEKSKIIKILQSALSTLETKKEEGKINRSTRRPIEREILKAIAQLKSGGFKIVKNKRPYMEIAVKNLVKEKDFIGILIK